MKISLAILTLFLSFNVLATNLIDKKSIINVGTVDSIKVGIQQAISIYLPDSYGTENNSFPVMYIIDGDKYFLNSIAYQKTLAWQSKSPEFIVVGINIDKKKRRDLLGKKSQEFIEIFQNQIIKYVDNNYRTNGKRMYFGWEMAGGFALDLFAQYPELIDAYFLASSTYFTKERIDRVESTLQDKKAISDFFYYTLGTVEAWSLDSHEMLSKVFTTANRANFKWELHISPSDDHYTTPLNTLNIGLASYFYDYAPIRFYSIKEFEIFGGINALKTHYKRRGESYQISTDIHSETKHYLLNQAINENDFYYFTKLVSEFDGFIESQNYSTGFILKIGQFYSDNKAIKEAVALYKSELIKNPENPKIIKELIIIQEPVQN
ncbi:alpha/beta hydrolase [Colwelliaceae bacterium 6441]